MKNYKIYIPLLMAWFSAHAQSQFTNNGNVYIHNGGAISFYGNFINNGSYVDSGQVSSLVGSSAQQVGGSAATTFKNLTLNNAAGCYLSASENIKGILTITSGTFTTTGYSFTLLSNINGTASIAPILGNFAGNITMQRYLGVGLTSWRFLCSPVTGATISNWQDDFSTTGFPGSTTPTFPFVSVYTYTESVPGVNTYGYTAPTNASNPITPTVGFLCYIGPVPLTVDLTGPPVKFGQTFGVTYTPSAGAYNDGWVLLGNPYPSAIDWTSAAWSKHNVNNAVYVWNDALQQYSSWVSGVSVNGGSNIIASSQSFWVQTNGASPTLSCTENVKVSANPKFLMPDSIAVFSNLKLIMTGNGYKDETFIRFGNGATNKFDAPLDAYKIFSSNTSVPGIASEDSTLRDMSINSMPSVTSQLYIPIKALVGTSGNYSIKLDSSSVVPLGSCLELEDKVTGVKTNIDNFSAYSFSISDTTKAARFILHVAPCGTITGVNQLADPYQLNAFPNPTTGIVTINYEVNGQKGDNAIMQLIDLGTGQIVMEKSVPVNSSQMQIDLSGLANGAYALNMLSSTNASEHIKIIKIK
jgi:hypothetical protein